jgi:hypothetical protein
MAHEANAYKECLETFLNDNSQCFLCRVRRTFDEKNCRAFSIDSAQPPFVPFSSDCQTALNEPDCSMLQSQFRVPWSITSRSLARCLVAQSPYRLSDVCLFTSSPEGFVPSPRTLFSQILIELLIVSHCSPCFLVRFPFAFPLSEDAHPRDQRHPCLSPLFDRPIRLFHSI